MSTTITRAELASESRSTRSDPARDDRRDPAGESSQTAVDKAIGLLHFLGGHQGAIGVSELARRTGLTKSTAFRLLGILERNGMVDRLGSDYQLSRQVYDLGAQVHAPRQAWLADILTPFVAELYELAHETVHLAVLHGPDVIYLAKLHGHRAAPAPSKVGAPVPAHCTAVGKAMLAYSPQAVDAVVGARLARLTPNTITDAARLYRELGRIRANGIAFDYEEAAPGLNCVATPVMGRGDRPVAALSIAGRTRHFDPRRYADRLRRVAYAASIAAKEAQTRPHAPFPSSGTAP